MRVAVVTQYFPSSAQQWAGHSAYQTLRLLASRCELKVFYPEARYPKLLTPKTHSHGKLDPAYRPDAVDATYIPYPVLPLVSRPLNGWTMYYRLLPHIRAYRPDVILNYVVYPDGFAATRIGRKLRIPVLLTAIGSDLNRISDRLSGVWTRSALQHADYVTTVSHDLLRTAVRMGADPARSRAILNGCDTSVFRPREMRDAREQLGLDASAEIVLYVGRLDVRKGLLELIEAVAQLRRDRGALCCYLLGGGSDRQLLENAIAQAGAAEFIRFAAPELTHRVALWMSAANLVTLPSYNEGCPNVVIEALAGGRPVVATDVGGIPELMDETSGALIKPRDIPSLVAGLQSVLNRRWNADELASRHNRSWSDVAEELEDLLRGLAPHGAAQQ